MEKDYEIPEPHVLEFEREVFSWIGGVWPFEAERGGRGSPPGHPRFITVGFYRDDSSNERFDPGWLMLREPNHPLREPMLESLRRLRSRYGEQELTTVAADLFFGQSQFWDYWHARNRENRHCDRQTVLFRIADAILVESPSPDIYERISGGTRARNIHLNGDSANLILALPSSPENLQLAERMVRGHPEARGQGPGRWSQVNLCPGLIERLFDAGRFDYETFVSIAHDSPGLLDAACDEDGAFYSGVGTRFNTGVSRRFKEAMLSYCRRLTEEFVSDPHDAEKYRLIEQMRLLRSGPELLLGAANLYQAFMEEGEPVKYSDLSSYRDQASRTVRTCIMNLTRAADARDILPPRRRELLHALREGFPTVALERLLPFAARSRDLLTEALGCERALPLAEAVAGAAKVDVLPQRATAYMEHDVIRSVPDPENGVLDVEATKAALEEAGEELGRQVLRLFWDAKAYAERTVSLFEAAAGWNREWVERRVEKRDQVAVKAYGLLPIERGEDEVLERYIFLKGFEKESKQFGSQRRSNERAAAGAALTNLARNAGYVDATRLEWAMEARAGGELESLPRRWHVGEYEVRLDLEGVSPRLSFRRGEKNLKSAPKAVRESEDYREIKEALKGMREQVTRLKTTLEGMMSSGAALSLQDLSGLSCLPVARTLLSALILSSEDGFLGLPRFGAPPGDPPALHGLDGASRRLTGPVALAHPYHLFRGGSLSQWQREVVRRRIVQPFKQAFRELYLLTPAEEESGTDSARFADHRVDSKVTSRLLSGRGWSFNEGGGEDETEPPYKTYCTPGGKLRATFAFEDIGRYFTEDDVMTGAIFFHLDPEGGPLTAEPRLPLDRVPVEIFSEVMRDADLVVSVAGREGGERLSEEAYERRGDLIFALLKELGLPAVSTAGHFAHVEGRLARYRVHLGSAAIHVEPGNYLCVVPERWGKRHKDLFLPFADEGDPKVAEVLSKVLVLANDDRIKDESILAQIRTRSNRP